MPGIVVTCTLGALVMCLLVFAFGFPAGRDRGGTSTAALLLTRLGHAAAGVAFAAAGLLAVVAMVRASQPVAGEGPRGGADLAQRLAGVEAQLATAQARLTRAESVAQAAEVSQAGLEARLARVEGRVGGVEARLGDVTAGLRQASVEVASARADLRRLQARVAATKARAVAERQASDAPHPTPGPGPRGEAATTPPSAARPAPGTGEPSAPSEVSALRPHLDAQRGRETSAPAPDGRQRAGAMASAPADNGPAAGPERQGEAGVARAEDAASPGLGRKLRHDWEVIKHEGRAAGDQIRSALRRLRDWLSFD
ncbi:MAG TPA: hypothetical protein VNK50_05595 [Calidithermus sp.]|nr:hypothetical protein [Calidithermus sp.]